MADPVVALLDQIWSSIEELCATFTPADWQRPTELPGWTVKDQLSHLCGIESRLLGRPQPDPLAQPWPPHIHNELGARNEAQIELRRSWPGEDVLTEFLELTAERLKMLAQMDDAQMSVETDGPLGKVRMRDMLAIRAVDCFYHEQDMRIATGRAGAMDTDQAAFVIGRMNLALPMIVAKKAALPDGTTVGFDVQGRAGFRTAIAVGDGRGSVASPDANPAATVTMDALTFLRLIGGRISRSEASVDIEGDRHVAATVLDAINVMF